MAEQRSIGDYALIGDCQTAALLRDGSVEWLCVPRFDSPSVFAAMLDAQRGGSFVIRPVGPYRSERQYAPGTHVLVTRFVCPSGDVEVTDCLAVQAPNSDQPAVDPAPYGALTRLVRCTSGWVTLDVRFNPRPDYARADTQLQERSGRWVIAAAGRRLVLDSDVPLRHDGHSGLRARLDLRAGDVAGFVLHYDGAPSASLPAVLDAGAAIDATRRFWRAWSDRLQYHGRYRAALSRSALVLKALMHTPSGAIVAAPTTSLPEELGSERNWDYRYCWLRDSTFTLYALEHLGYSADAHKFSRWIERASHDNPDNLRIAYTIDGREIPAEQTLPELSGFAGSKPVRIGNGARNQTQLDVYGELLDVAFFAAKHKLGIDDSYWSLLAALADYIAGNWRQPDHGMWEMRSEPRQFVYSKVYCWVCLNRAVRLARSLGKRAPRHWRQSMDAIRTEVLEQGYNESVGAFVQSYGSTHLDAANLLLPIVGFIDARDPRMLATVRRTEERLSEHGFLRRYRDADDGVSGDETAFTLCSFWLVDVLIMQGERGRARDLFERLLQAGNDLGLLSEEYDPAAQIALGNFPQAFSHLGLITSALNLRYGQADRRHAHRAHVRHGAPPGR